MVRLCPWLIIGCATLACSGGRETRNVLSLAPAREPVHATPAPEPAAQPGRVLASEAEARALLGERFRGAGLRVRYDVLIEDAGLYALTADGYDPEAGIGFEYIAEEERGTDLGETERAVIERSRARLLVLDAMPPADVTAAADAFLGALGRSP